MISRSHRFHGYNSLRLVYGKGRQVRAQHFSVKYTVNDRRRKYRLAVVVSKKVSKSAVVRNRIRRRVYEIMRNHEAAIHLPYDIVITVFSDTVADMPSNRLQDSIGQLLNQAEITKRVVVKNTD